MLFTPFCLVLSCLQVSPDRSQFFRYDKVALTCKEHVNATGWRVKRKTPEGWVRHCSSGWGTLSSDSSCVIGNMYPADTGMYWCESADGSLKSNTINITITDRTVRMDVPSLPVPEGVTVILGCKAEKFDPKHTFDFQKDGRAIGSNSEGKITLPDVTKSDEGVYTCSVPGYGASLGSKLIVRGDSLPPSVPPVASCSVSVFRLVCHLVVGTPYLVSTIMLGLICRDRNRAARTVADRRGSNDVIMEIVV